MPKLRSIGRAGLALATAAFIGLAPLSVAAEPPLGPPLPSESPTAAIEQLLDYFYYVNDLTDEQIQREYDSLSASRLTPNSIDDLRLAMLLSVPGSVMQDRDRARTLVARYLRYRDQEDALSRFAFFLDALLNDEDSRSQELVMYQKKVEVLQRQLDQLKSIEQSINEDRHSTTVR